ncbi:MAG: hypothetical protein LBT53_06160 [Puniceicoccales bacterium]|jgi:hypothetical protein|nr:hypothetical protein [Puniceicoccales bacterium]
MGNQNDNDNSAGHCDCGCGGETKGCGCPLGPNPEKTLAFWVLRAWLGARALFTGLSKFEAKTVEKAKDVSEIRVEDYGSVLANKAAEATSVGQGADGANLGLAANAIKKTASEATNAAEAARATLETISDSKVAAKAAEAAEAAKATLAGITDKTSEAYTAAAQAADAAAAAAKQAAAIADKTSDTYKALADVVNKAIVSANEAAATANKAGLAVDNAISASASENTTHIVHHGLPLSGDWTLQSFTDAGLWYMPKWALNLFDSSLGYVLIALGVTLLLGIGTRVSLFLQGLLYTGLTLGFIGITKEPGSSSGITMLGVHVLVVVVALVLAKHNKLAIQSKLPVLKNL